MAMAKLSGLKVNKTPELQCTLILKTPIDPLQWVWFDGRFDISMIAAILGYHIKQICAVFFLRPLVNPYT